MDRPRIELTGSGTSNGRLALRASTVVWLLVTAAACATPSENAARLARDLGLQQERVRGTGFDHVVYERAEPASAGGLLQFYLEGDGAPARAVRWRPPDPTPRSPLALRLMALDPGPAVYLGRPCQHGTTCRVTDWTTGRYSEAAVRSLRQAVVDVAARLGARQWRLIGYSGGGTLAMLMAEDLPGTVGVVTLAGNLDVAGWSELHDYTPLHDSLDPSQRPPLDPEVRQLHLVGGRDETVPQHLTRGAIAHQPAAEVRRFDDFDHDCCWADAWPDLVRELRSEEAR